jgi:hypothetical protein
MHFYKNFILFIATIFAINMPDLNAMQPASTASNPTTGLNLIKDKNISFIDFTNHCFAVPEFNYPIAARNFIKPDSFANKFVSAEALISLLDEYFINIYYEEFSKGFLKKNTDLSLPSFINIETLNPLVNPADNNPVKTIDHIATISDIHGSIHSVARDLWQLVCNPYFQLDNNLKINNETVTDGVGHRTKIVFTGDIVDRGRHSIESLFLVIRLFLENPGQVYIIRGNHEQFKCHQMYTLWGEIDQKYTQAEAKIIKEKIELFFNTLPVATLFKRTDENGSPSNLLFCHGGIPCNFTLNQQNIIIPNSMLDLKKLAAETPSFGLFGINTSNMIGFLASDFTLDLTSQVQRLTPNFPRGGINAGCISSQLVAKSFLSDMNLLCIIRGHQHGEAGSKILLRDINNLKRLLIKKYINKNLKVLKQSKIVPENLAHEIDEDFYLKCTHKTGLNAELTHNLSFWQALIQGDALNESALLNPQIMADIDKIFNVTLSINGQKCKYNTLFSIILAEEKQPDGRGYDGGPIDFKEVLAPEDFTENGVSFCSDKIIPVLTNSTATEGAAVPEDCVNILTISPVNAECCFYPYTTPLAQAWTNQQNIAAAKKRFAQYSHFKYSSISIHRPSEIDNKLNKTNIDLEFYDAPATNPISQDLMQQITLNTRNHETEKNVMERLPDASPAVTVMHSPAGSPNPGIPTPSASPIPLGKNSVPGLLRPNALRKNETTATLENEGAK